VVSARLRLDAAEKLLEDSSFFVLSLALAALAVGGQRPPPATAVDESGRFILS
jgi:hypothetical protein